MPALPAISRHALIVSGHSLVLSLQGNHQGRQGAGHSRHRCRDAGTLGGSRIDKLLAARNRDGRRRATGHDDETKKCY